MPNDAKAGNGADDARYPRPPLVRGLRLLLRCLWMVMLLGAFAAVAPNAWYLYQKTLTPSAFLDPNNLSGVLYLPEVTQFFGGDTTALIEAAIGAGALLLVLLIAGALAGRDARRERRTLRKRRASRSAGVPAGVPVAASTPLPVAESMAAGEVAVPAVEGAAHAVADEQVTPPTLVSHMDSLLSDMDEAAQPPEHTPYDSAGSAAQSGTEWMSLEEPSSDVAATEVAAPGPWGELPAVEPTFPSSVESLRAAYADTIESTELPSMSNVPPQYPPQDQNDTASSAPSWWATAPAAAAAPPQVSAPPNYSAAPDPLSAYPSAATYPPAPRSVPAPPGDPGASGVSQALQGFGRAAVASVPLLANAVQATQSYVGQLTAPQQDETGVSPAPFAAKARGWDHSKPLTDADLGYRIDGWADTVVGMADHAPKMIASLVEDLPTHFRPSVNALSTRLGMSGVSTLAKGIDIPVAPMGVVRVAQSVPKAVTALPRLILRIFGVKIIGKQRDYLFAVTTPGAIVGIMITGAGNDLYMAWDLFLRRVWNEVVIGLLGVIAVLIGFVGAYFGYAAARSPFTSYLSAGYSGYYGYGQPASPSPMTVFWGVVGGFVVFAFWTFIWLFVAGAILGWIFKRDPLGFFRKEIDLFEAHDVQSMALSVHKSLMRAADRAGIDQKLLREKRDFVTGRDRRVI